MCAIIFYKNNEIETPQQLIDCLGISIDKLCIPKNYDLKLSRCLCQIDLKKTLRENNYNYTIDPVTGDYNVYKINCANCVYYDGVYCGNSIVNRSCKNDYFTPPDDFGCNQFKEEIKKQNGDEQ